jgi:hypothetical protein
MDCRPGMSTAVLVCGRFYLLQEMALCGSGSFVDGTKQEARAKRRYFVSMREITRTVTFLVT